MDTLQLSTTPDESFLEVAKSELIKEFGQYLDEQGKLHTLDEGNADVFDERIEARAEKYKILARAELRRRMEKLQAEIRGLEEHLAKVDSDISTERIEYQAKKAYFESKGKNL